MEVENGGLEDDWSFLGGPVSTSMIMGGRTINVNPQEFQGHWLRF